MNYLKKFNENFESEEIDVEIDGKKFKSGLHPNIFDELNYIKSDDFFRPKTRDGVQSKKEAEKLIAYEYFSNEVIDYLENSKEESKTVYADNGNIKIEVLIKSEIIGSEEIVDLLIGEVEILN